MAELPPQDLLAEQYVLGAILTSKTAIDEVSEILKPEHFYKPAHGTIYQIVLDLTNRGDPVDAAIANAELASRGMLQKVGQTYLIELISGYHVAANAATYARIIHDKWRLRKLIEVCTRGVQLGYTEASTTQDVDALLALADAEFRTLLEAPEDSVGFADLITSWRESVDDKKSIIPSPWPIFNKEVLGGGFRKGKVYIVSAGTGVGKSIFGLNCWLKAMEDGRRSQLFSIEMPREEVASRLIAAGANAKYAEIFRKSMTKDTHDTVEEWIHSASGYQIDVNDRASITVEEIGAGIRKYKPDFVFVDYIQLVSPSDPKAQREQQVGHITTVLKRLAKDCRVAIVAASQVNSDGELRESKKQAMDADLVVFLEDKGNGVLRASMKKNRDGKKGHVDFVFRGDVQRIGD